MSKDEYGYYYKGKLDNDGDIYGNTRMLPSHLQTAQTIIDSFK